MKFLMALLLLSPGITPDEVVKLKKAGISDETIMSVIDADRTVFRLDSDEIIRLKQEGLSDRLLHHMVSTSKTAPAREGKGLLIENRSSTPVRVHVDPAGRTVEFDGNRGTILAAKSSREWEAPTGNYRVLKAGKAFAYGFDAPNRITLRGCSLGNMEILTAYVEKAGERDTFLVRLEENDQEPVTRSLPLPTRPRYALRSRYGRDSGSGNRVLLGAGIGAIIGHQSDRAWEGALIGGGAGLLFDQFLRCK